MLLQLGVCFCQLVAVNHFFFWLFIVVYTKLLYLSSDKVAWDVGHGISTAY